jgi:hypothetical protein
MTYYTPCNNNWSHTLNTLHCLLIDQHDTHAVSQLYMPREMHMYRNDLED